MIFLKSIWLSIECFFNVIKVYIRNHLHWSFNLIDKSLSNNIDLAILKNSDIVEQWNWWHSNNIKASGTLLFNFFLNKFTFVYRNIQIRNIGKLHGCHYVPLLIVVLLDIFQKKSYQFHHHHSRHKVCQ